MVYLESQKKAAIQRSPICGKIQNFLINFAEWVIITALFETIFQRFASRYPIIPRRGTPSLLYRTPFQQPSLQIKMRSREPKPNVRI